MKTILCILLVALTACGESYRKCGPVQVYGKGIPDSFCAEIAAAVQVIGPAPGNAISVEDAPYFNCATSANGKCEGESGGGSEITIAYDPAVGLGPDVGSTALEYELCLQNMPASLMSLNGDNGGTGPIADSASACATNSIPLIKAKLQ